MTLRITGATTIGGWWTIPLEGIDFDPSEIERVAASSADWNILVTETDTTVASKRIVPS